MNAMPRAVRVPIGLGERSYDILIGAGLLGDARSLEGLPQSAQALIVTNSGSRAQCKSSR